MSDVVSYEVVDRVGVVTIERPEAHNAMSLDVFDQLRMVGEQAAADPTARAVVVRGRGASFSSGLDVSTFGVEGGIDDALIVRLQEAFTVYEEMDKVSIAAVRGYCFGGGIQLAIACHLRLATPDAQFSVLERKWGLVPDLGGTVRLPRLVGLGRATEMTVTARRVPADEALRIGLVDVALTSDDADAEALAFAKAVADAPTSTGWTPRLLRENLDRTGAEGRAAERATQLRAIAHEDFATTVAARFEGREPQY